MKIPLTLKSKELTEKEKKIIKKFIKSWKDAYDSNIMPYGDYHRGRYYMLKQMLGKD